MRAAAMALLGLLLLGRPAAAVGPIAGGPAVGTAPPSESVIVDRLLADLDHPDAPRRLFAARELRRRVKQALRLSESDRGDALDAQAALLELQVYDERLAPRCLLALSEPQTLLPCVDVLGLLETEAARPGLEELARGGKRRARRHAERALERLGPAEAP